MPIPRLIARYVCATLTAAMVISLAGCAPKKSQFPEFSRAASTGLALGQQATVDAEFETQALIKKESNPLTKARLESISRSHQTALDAMGKADKDVSTSRKQFWEMKRAFDRQIEVNAGLRESWLSVRQKRQLGWIIAIASASSVLMLLFSSWMPRGWLGGAMRWIFTFIVSIPGRIAWLFVSKAKAKK